MGMLAETVQYVRSLSKRLPHKFSVVELGDQWITCETPHRLARDLYQDMGCGRFESVDANGCGTLTWDLNLPLPKDFGTFDLVTDFGTGEHVFNQHQVFKTIHFLCKPGGWMVFDRPTQGYDGHCFWLASQALYEDLAAANGYVVLWMEQTETKRGTLLRGAFRRGNTGKFVTPQQGRYKKILKIGGAA